MYNWYSGVQELVLKRVSKPRTYKYDIIEVPNPRREAIIGYVRKHDGCNKKELCDYMDSKLSEKPPVGCSTKITYKKVA